MYWDREGSNPNANELINQSLDPGNHFTEDRVSHSMSECNGPEESRSPAVQCILRSHTNFLHQPHSSDKCLATSVCTNDVFWVYSSYCFVQPNGSICLNQLPQNTFWNSIYYTAYIAVERILSAKGTYVRNSARN